MKKIITLLVSVVMIMTLSFGVSAAELDPDNGSYVLDIVLSKTEVNVGETYTVSVYMKDANAPSETIDFYGGFGSFCIYLDHNEEVATWDKASSTLTNFGLKASNFSIHPSGKMYVETATDADAIIAGNSPVFVLAFKAVAPGTITYDSGDFGIADQNFAEFSTSAGNTIVNKATVTVKAAGGEEEFEPTYEGFVEEEGGEVKTGFKTGSKVATVFAKAETALTAGTYGIVFGGQKYVGAADVKDGKYWVIRLYDPDGNVLDFSKDYACQTFVGESFSDADYQTASKN